MAYAGEIVTLNGTGPAVLECTAGGTIAQGDVIKITASTGKVDVAAANATQAVGWALNAAALNEKVNVLLAVPTQGVWMKKTGIWVATMFGQRFGLTGSSGGQTVNLSDTTNDLFKALGYDSTSGCVLVIIPDSNSEVGAKERV